MEIKIRSAGQEDTGFYIRFWIKNYNKYDGKRGSAMIIYPSGMSFFEKPEKLTVAMTHAIMLFCLQKKSTLKAGEIYKIPEE